MGLINFIGIYKALEKQSFSRFVGFQNVPHFGPPKLPENRGFPENLVLGSKCSHLLVIFLNGFEHLARTPPKQSFAGLGFPRRGAGLRGASEGPETSSQAEVPETCFGVQNTGISEIRFHVMLSLITFDKTFPIDFKNQARLYTFI